MNLISLYFRKVGKLYLKKIFEPILQKAASLSGPFEVGNIITRILILFQKVEQKHLNEKDKVQKCVNNLTQATDLFLDAILISADECPM
jgi:hypothetical protein